MRQPSIMRVELRSLFDTSTKPKILYTQPPLVFLKLKETLLWSCPWSGQIVTMKQHCVLPIIFPKEMGVLTWPAYALD